MSSTQTGRANCYICAGGHQDLLITHHIVPCRFGGSDESENLVDICPTCHRALELLYNKRFYDELGVKPETSQTGRLDPPHVVCASFDTRDAKRTTVCEKTQYSLRTVPCHYCRVKVEPAMESAYESICEDCIDEHVTYPA